MGKRETREEEGGYKGGRKTRCCEAEAREGDDFTRSTPVMRVSRWSGSGKRWKISEIGLAIPLQACPDMGLYCSFAFIAFDYKLAETALFVAPRPFVRSRRADFKNPRTASRAIDRYLGGNMRASIDRGSKGKKKEAPRLPRSCKRWELIYIIRLRLAVAFQTKH